MNELDPGVRARLEYAATWLRTDEEDPEYIQLGGDIEALLAAYDAAVAERDAAIERREDCHAWHQEAERERNQLRVKVGTLERKVAYAEAERDQYAAVGAAARVYATTPQTPEHIAARVRALDAICAAVAALPGERP